MLDGPQCDEFAARGYVIVRNAIPEELLVSVDREVTALVGSDPPSPGVTGTHFYFLPPDQLPAADNALRESGALGLAEQLTSPHKLGHGYGHIQVALNLPSWEYVPEGPHLDGYHDPERPHPFTLLAAVFLGDESTSGSGNLWVWPGSHIAHAELFRSRGVTALMETGGHPSLVAEPPDIGEPVPVLANRGDLLLAHYLLGHNSGGNTTAVTRRAIYYRLSTTENDSRWQAAMADPFLEYSTIRA